ncbi:zinc-dependent alcohol dehydrogenase family protein [Sphingomonas sp. UYP23]
MRRWLLPAHQNGIAALRLEKDVAVPEPGPGEVRIRVRSVSLNYRDLFVLDGAPGWRPDTDLVPVADASGEIDAIGAGVEDWQIGDRAVTLYTRGWTDGPPPLDLTMGLGAAAEQGVLAEYVVLPATRVAPAPAGLDWAEAATLPCAGVTAWSAVFDGKPVGPGTRLMAPGTGGVALFALLLARAAGAEVYGTSSSDAKLDRLRELGVTEAINHRKVPDWGADVFRRLGGVDKVIDPVGEINRAMAALRPGGEIAVMGLMAQDGPPNPMFFMGRTLTIRGIAVGSAAAYEQLRAFIEEHGIRPPVGARFAFEDVAKAYAAQHEGVFGKVVIEVAR